MHKASRTFADTGLGLLPALMKLAAHSVGSRFENDFRTRKIRDSLHNAGEMSFGVGPEPAFRSVE